MPNSQRIPRWSGEGESTQNQNSAISHGARVKQNASFPEDVLDVNSSVLFRIDVSDKFCYQTEPSGPSGVAAEQSARRVLSREQMPYSLSQIGPILEDVLKVIPLYYVSCSLRGTHPMRLIGIGGYYYRIA